MPVPIQKIIEFFIPVFKGYDFKKITSSIVRSNQFLARFLRTVGLPVGPYFEQFAKKRARNGHRDSSIYFFIKMV